MTPVELVLGRLERVKRNGTGWVARCPAHDDRNPSLSISESDGGHALLNCHAGCTLDAILAELELTQRDLFAAKTESEEWTPRGPAVAVYPYRDEGGRLLYEVCRTVDKQFPQRRPDPAKASGWRWNLNGTRRVPYRLPEVLEACAAGGRVFVAEGEKDADALARLGVVATCNPGGAGKWRDGFSEPLRGASEIVVVADNDEAGIRHARTVERSLRKILGAEPTITVVVPKAGKDAADHVAAGHGVDDLVPLTVDQQATHSWTPIDLVATAGLPPEPPTISSIAYPGRRHVWSGEPESGKSWVALIACVEQVQQGRSAVYIDFEMGRREVLARLRDLDVADELIRDRFVYLEPSEPLSDDAVRADVARMLADRTPSLVIVDAMTGALRLHGADPNKAADVDAFYAHIVDLLRGQGAAVVILDHLPKDTANRGKFAIGSERKVGAADVHLGFEVIQPFGRGKSGRFKITTHKDRPGYLPRPRAAEVELESSTTSGRITWKFQAATPTPDTGFRPTNLMEKVSRYLEIQTGPVSRNTVETAVTGKAVFLRSAIDILTAEKYVTEQLDGQTRNVSSARPYREADDPTSSTSSRLVPTSSRTQSDTTSSPRPPLQGGRGRGTRPTDDPHTHHLVPPDDEVERLAQIARTHDQGTP